MKRGAAVVSYVIYDNKKEEVVNKYPNRDEIIRVMSGDCESNLSVRIQTFGIEDPY